MAVGLVLAGCSLAQAQRRPELALPQRQQLRVNDTLVLEVSRPLARFRLGRAPGYRPGRGRPGTEVLCGRAVLRGRRGYSEVLHHGLPYCTLYLAAIGPGGGVLALPYWSDVNKRAAVARTQPHDTVWAEHPQDFGYSVWDVRYRTWAQLLDADLQELPSPPEVAQVFGFELTVVGFAGGTYRGRAYHLLPHWLNRELARVRRTHHLPPAARLEAFLSLTYDESGIRLARPHRPLLARLLRAYAACPPPGPVVAGQLAEARQALAFKRP